ncbi:helix-turn-helix domain-containing protein [Corynebacterium pyruviciproducens]|uniref:Helix-turn-helix domain-containing protein n=1 Tax=Corynebacterium pyruviciproducens TaxID=598660 RepID=A0AAF0YRC5_9CORY|nr:helix-turn-helix domain-containing protein [Corynebacterium pyruviciproducens]WOT02012.1 helix-turn-helix domain-containing protein [Corynebacterium pyruviciproducens]
MSKTIPPEIRRKIIKFDPFDGHGLSITAFCEQLKISRRTFYNIRARYDEEAGGALHPHSSAPITPARTYDEHVTTALLVIRKRLKGQGWDYGPISIRFEGSASGELTDPVPSVSTIARLLRAAGVTRIKPEETPQDHPRSFPAWSSHAHVAN